MKNHCYHEPHIIIWTQGAGYVDIIVTKPISNIKLFVLLIAALLGITVVQATVIILAEGAFVYGLSTVLSEYRDQAIQQLTLVNT